jgi:hypothetical protein
VTWHFTFEMQITHSHLTVYIWGTHSTLSPHSIHLKCSYQTPTLQYTSEVQIPPSHLTGLSKVHLMAYIWGADTRLLPYSIYYVCRYHLPNLQYTSEVPIPPSHLTVYTDVQIPLSPYSIHFICRRATHNLPYTHTWATDTSLPPHSIHLRYGYHQAIQ